MNCSKLPSANPNWHKIFYSSCISKPLFFMEKRFFIGIRINMYEIRILLILSNDYFQSVMKKTKRIRIKSKPPCSVSHNNHFKYPPTFSLVTNSNGIKTSFSNACFLAILTAVSMAPAPCWLAFWKTVAFNSPF